MVEADAKNISLTKGLCWPKFVPEPMLQLSPTSFLLALSIGGATVTLLAAAWSVTQKEMVKGEDGRRRLKPSGFIALGFAMITALISVSSLAYTFLMEQNSAALAASKKQAEDERIEFRRELDRQYADWPAHLNPGIPNSNRRIAIVLTPNRTPDLSVHRVLIDRGLTYAPYTITVREDQVSVNAGFCRGYS